ncbi:MAG: PilZ domain-containing protein [Acidobacteria bacterium]|nr:PilZ domain-containing protein [Acidobacteriota bacterium]
MSSNEQREHDRYPEKLAVDVHVFVLPAAQSLAGYEAHGRTIDIGRGGVLMRLDKEVTEGVKVRLRFWELPAGVRLWPLMVSGTLVRLEPGEGLTSVNMIGAGSLLAIEFTEPLKELEVPREG